MLAQLIIMPLKFNRNRFRGKPSWKVKSLKTVASTEEVAAELAGCSKDSSSSSNVDSLKARLSSHVSNQEKFQDLDCKKCIKGYHMIDLAC